MNSGICSFCVCEPISLSLWEALKAEQEPFVHLTIFPLLYSPGICTLISLLFLGKPGCFFRCEDPVKNSIVPVSLPFQVLLTPFKDEESRAKMGWRPATRSHLNEL